MSQQNQTSAGVRSQEIGLTHEDFAILCRADSQSPTLIKMIVGDGRDAAVMELMAGVPNKCWGAFCADVEAGRQPW